MPRSSAVVRPSASGPTTTWPFSMRNVLIASVPYGMMPNGFSCADDRFPHREAVRRPARESRRRARPSSSCGTAVPGCARRRRRARIRRPQGTETPRWKRRSITSSASTSRAIGPASAAAAHCSVTDVANTSSSGHSTCSRHSRCCMTLTAFTVVVVISVMRFGRAAKSCRRRTPCRRRAASRRSGSVRLPACPSG